jgi:hypothetical protein
MRTRHVTPHNVRAMASMPRSVYVCRLLIQTSSLTELTLSVFVAEVQDEEIIQVSKNHTIELGCSRLAIGAACTGGPIGALRYLNAESGHHYS